MSWFCCAHAWFFQWFLLTLVSYFHDNDKSLKWWNLHWKNKTFFTAFSWLYTIEILLWWLMKQSPYHIYNCVYCFAEIFPKNQPTFGLPATSLIVEFRIHLPQRRTVCGMSPWTLVRFLEHMICVKNTIPNHHFTLGNWCKCIRCINRLCLRVDVQFDLFSIHPNWFVEYPSQPVGFCPSTVLQSSIVQMQSPGPTNAFAHIAADQIESWSNPVGTFWRFAVGRLAIWWIDRTNYQPDTDTIMRLSLCLSHVNIKWRTTKEVRTHDDLIRRNHMSTSYFSSMHRAYFSRLSV